MCLFQRGEKSLELVCVKSWKSSPICVPFLFPKSHSISSPQCCWPRWLLFVHEKRAQLFVIVLSVIVVWFQKFSRLLHKYSHLFLFQPEPKKRSIFDTSSSEEEPEQIRPVKQITSTVKQPNLTDSEEEEMPKSVLNSVSNDFSSRLNQALLKRPSPSPSVIQLKFTFINFFKFRVE